MALGSFHFYWRVFPRRLMVRCSELHCWGEEGLIRVAVFTLSLLL